VLNPYVQVISLKGKRTDPESGNLYASAYAWLVNFHHHMHPAMLATSVSVGSSLFLQMAKLPPMSFTGFTHWFQMGRDMKIPRFAMFCHGLILLL